MTFFSSSPLSPSPSPPSSCHQECDAHHTPQGAFRVLRGAQREPDVIFHSARLREVTTCETEEQWQQWPQALASLLVDFDVTIRRGDPLKLEPNANSHSAGIGAFKTAECEKREPKLESQLVGHSAGYSECEKGGQWQRTPAATATDEPNVISFKATMTTTSSEHENDGTANHEPNVISYSAGTTNSHCEEREVKSEPDVISDSAGDGDGRAATATDEPDVISYNATTTSSDHKGDGTAKDEPNVVSYSAATTNSHYHRRGTRRWRRRDEGRARRPQLQSWDQGVEAPHCEEREANATYLREVGGEDREGRAVAAGTARSGRQSWSQILYLVFLLLLLAVGKKWEAKADPDVISYSAGIARKGRKAGGEAGARLKMPLIEKCDMEPKPVINSAGISVCEKGEAKLEPNLVVYSAVPTVCDEGGQWQQALTRINERWKAKQKPDTISYPPLHFEKWEAKLKPELISNNVGNSVRDTDGQGQQVRRVRANGHAARTPSCEKWEAEVGARCHQQLRCAAGGRTSHSLLQCRDPLVRE